MTEYPRSLPSAGELREYEEARNPILDLISCLTAFMPGELYLFVRYLMLGIVRLPRVLEQEKGEKIRYINDTRRG